MNQLQAAQACSLVYAEDNWDSLQHLLGVDDYAFFDDPETCAFFGFTDQAQYMIFRGTFSEPGWILDLDFFPEVHPDYPGKVHRGFSRGFGDFKKWVSEFYDPKKQTYVAGHSLGGAMATLAGYHYNPVITYTFGSPRVGDAEFVKGYKVNQVRFVHDLDPIPHVPFGVDFEHVCDAIHIGNGWFSALIQHLRFGFHGALKAAMNDHNIEEYLNAML
jgi:predicted lipase